MHPSPDEPDARRTAGGPPDPDANGLATVDAGGPGAAGAPGGPGGASAAISDHLKERDVFGRVPKDRADWSHRKGEPRVLVLAWTIYLMVAVIGMFGSLAATRGLTPDVMRTATRGLFVASAVGLAVLWPMVRLSQRIPGGRLAAEGLRDVLVIVAPVQAVIWPQSLWFLAAWPLDVALAVSGVLIAWSLVIAGLIAIGWAALRALGERPDDPAAVYAGVAPGPGVAWFRVVWMVVLLVVAFGAPLGVALAGGMRPENRPDPGRTVLVRMLSPTMAVAEVLRDRAPTGRAARVMPGQWLAIGVTAASGVGLLGAASALGVAAARRAE